MTSQWWIKFARTAGILGLKDMHLRKYIKNSNLRFHAVYGRMMEETATRKEKEAK
jgi:hypothetical protein